MARCQPSSWADDLNSYRETFGSQSYGAKGHEPIVERVPRTFDCPLGGTRHPNFSGGSSDKTNVNPAIQTQRYIAHGWNDTSLLKEDQPVEENSAGRLRGRRVPDSHASQGTQRGLFGVIQGYEQQVSDSWIGNSLIDPTKGKSSVPPPADTRGRKNLFDVLNGNNPGTPADDLWLGNQLINPSVGKLRPPGPEENAGRRDLFQIVQQTTNSYPSDAGSTTLTDSWIGNRLIDPTKGKQRVEGMRASEAHLIASTFRGGYPQGWSDMKKPHARKVIPEHMKNEPTARHAITGFCEEPLDDKGLLSAARHELVNDVPNGDFYALLQHDSEGVGQEMFGAWDDSRIRRRKPIHPRPGEVHPAKGPEMLYWKPNGKTANYIKYGGLMQEQFNFSRPCQYHNPALEMQPTNVKLQD